MSIIVLLTCSDASDSLFDVIRLNDPTQALWPRSSGSSFWVLGGNRLSIPFNVNGAEMGPLRCKEKDNA